MDAIEQRDRIIGLVRLQLADQMQLDVRVALAQAGPLVLRFLHAVFAKNALPSGDQRRDACGGVSLADRDQSHVFGAALRDLRGAGDASLNVVQGNCWISHRALL